VSNLLHATVKEGDELTLSAPFGGRIDLAEVEIPAGAVAYLCGLFPVSAEFARCQVLGDDARHPFAGRHGEGFDGSLAASDDHQLTSVLPEVVRVLGRLGGKAQPGLPRWSTTSTWVAVVATIPLSLRSWTLRAPGIEVVVQVFVSVIVALSLARATYLPWPWNVREGARAALSFRAASGTAAATAMTMTAWARRAGVTP
jgi:hypothetical protein